MNWILFGKIVLWSVVLFISYVWIVWFFHWLKEKRTAKDNAGGFVVLFILGLIDLIMVALLITIYNPAK